MKKYYRRLRPLYRLWDWIKLTIDGYCYEPYRCKGYDLVDAAEGSLGFGNSPAYVGCENASGSGYVEFTIDNEGCKLVRIPGQPWIRLPKPQSVTRPKLK